MKCRTGHVTVTAITAVLAVLLVPGTAAAGAAGPGNCLPSVQSLAYFYGAYSSDGSPPNRAYLDPGSWRQSCKPSAPPETREVAPAKRIAKSNCNWTLSRAVCKDGARLTLPSRERSGRSVAAARPNTRSPSDHPATRAAFAGVVPVAMLSRDSKLAMGSLAEPGPNAGFPIARYADRDAIATPLESPTGRSSLPYRIRERAGEASTAPEPAEADPAPPEPHTILFIGIALAAFMMFRRLAYG